MKNATLSVLLLSALGLSGTWVMLAMSAPSSAAAQDDDTAVEGEDAPAEDAEGDAAEGEDAAAEDAEGDAAEGETADGEVDDGHDEIEPPDGLTDQEEADVEAAGAALTAPDPETPNAAAPDANVDEVADDAEDEAEEEEAPAGPPELPWRNTFFSWTHQATFNSFIRDSQLSYNPNYSQNFTLSPRWYVAPTSFFALSQTLAVEITDTDGDALNRDPQVTDTVIDFRHMIPWEGFVFLGAARVVLPISKYSQFAQRYLQTGLGLTVVRPISEANLTLALVGAYRRWWAGSNVERSGEAQPDRCPTPPALAEGTAAPQLNVSTCDQFGGASTARDVILYGGALTWVPLAGLNFSLSVFGFTTYGHELAPAYIEVDTQDEPLRIDDGSPSHWNNFTYVALAVGYQFTPWLNISVGIQNSGVVAPLYRPDGSVANFFTPDTQAFLTASFQVDSIYTEIVGGGDDGLTPEERQRRRQGLASGPTTGGAF